MNFRKTDPPLTPAVFHILLAISTQERHGYEIMKQVLADSEGKVSMGPGTLYGSLKRMLEAGLVEETRSNDRRIYYKATGLGQKAYQKELSRLQRIIKITEKLSVLSNFTYEVKFAV